MDACVDTGYILGTNSCIGTEDTGISLVQTNSITSKSSWYEGTENKLPGDI